MKSKKQKNPCLLTFCSKKTNKKAQGLSLNVIILAAIALLVLIILTVFFSSRMGKFSSGLEDCGAKGGTPVKQASACGEFAPIPMKDTNYKYCCLNVTG